MNLEELRHQIDTVDREMTELLEQRMALVEQIAAFKKSNHTAVHDSAREQVVLNKIATYVKNSAYCDTILATYKDIMAHSRAYQTNLLEK